MRIASALGLVLSLFALGVVDVGRRMIGRGCRPRRVGYEDGLYVDYAYRCADRSLAAARYFPFVRERLVQIGKCPGRGT